MATRRPRALRLRLEDRLGVAIDYLEEHLDSELDLDVAARCAGFSRTHFMRIFHAAVGMSVGEYARRRRLSRAAEALLGGSSVVEAALTWGYGSQATFTRAFSRAFGVSPAAYVRRARAGAPPVDLLFPFEARAPFDHGHVEPPIRVELEGFRVAGIGARVTSRRFQSFGEVPALWHQWFAEARFRALGANAQTPVFGLSRMTAGGELEYVVGVEVGPHARVPRGYRAVPLAAATYAVYAAEGIPSRTLQRLVLAAYGRGTLDPGLARQPDGWDVEVLFGPASAQPRARSCELWIPLRR